MAFHLPDLDQLEKMADREIRFYAIVGILMSLNGTLERLEFATFHKGTKLTEEMAGSVFYKVRNDTARSDMARAAMDIRMSADAANRTTWEALAKRLNEPVAVQARNLVSHNPAVRELRPESTSLLMGLWNHIPEGFVRQDPIQVRYAKKADAMADFHRLRKACEHLHPLLNDLEAFLDSLPPT